MPELIRESSDDGASASASATGHSLSQAAVGLGATALRETGLATPSQETTAQATQLVEAAVARMEALARDTGSPGSSVGRIAALLVSVFMSVLLAAAVVVGLWVFNQRVSSIEQKLEDVALVKARQDALVLHLLASVEMIAKAQGVELPRPPAVLRIAEAQAAQAASQ